MKTGRKFIILILLAFAAGGVLAQKKGREPELRTVHGTVVDKQESPTESAVVYLKNAHTQDIKTYISDNQGEYRFSGRQHPGAGSLASAQISVLGEVFVGVDDHASRHPEIAGQGARRWQHGARGQSALLDGRPQLLPQLLTQAASFGPIKCQQDVPTIGLFKII